MRAWRQIFNLLRNLPTGLTNLRALLLVATVACALAMFFDPRPDNQQELTEMELLTVNKPALSQEELKPQIELAPLNWSEFSVSYGDNLSTLFQKANLSALDVYKVSSARQGKLLLDLYPGEVLRFGVNNVGVLQELHYQKTPLESYVFIADDQGYHSEYRLREPEVLTSYRQGVIEESLYLAGKKANLPDKIVMELANIFGWDIDFVFDIRTGDSFALLFEERYIDGQLLGSGNILVASFTNRGKTYNAVRFEDSQGQSNYYTPEGLSMRKAFLRTPLDIFRISSGFNLRRKHPIHKNIKAHRGVDYAAPRGTPVYASGDGKVVEAGYTKANGNYVFIQHGQTYTTKYLHLNSKKVRSGQSVRQRQVIGTVGSTGYATGPHLHYEFLVNGVHRNPRTVALPKANPISKAERAAFKQRTSALLAQLADFQQSSQLALNEKSQGEP